MAANKGEVENNLRLIEPGNIEVRYPDGRIEQLTPQALEARCQFRWQEYFTSQSNDLTDEKLFSLFKERMVREYKANLGTIPSDAQIEAMFPIISTEQEFETFRENLLKPSELCLYDMGPLGFALAAKEKLSKGRAIVFTGNYQCTHVNQQVLQVDNPDYSYTLVDFSEASAKGQPSEGLIYYVNPAKQGGLARFMQNLPVSSEYEAVDEGKAPLHFSEIDRKEIATENVMPSLYRIYRRGRRYFLPAVFSLTRDVEAGELIGFEYGDAGHWLKLGTGLDYPALLFKGPKVTLQEGRVILSHVVPQQYWKRSYGGVMRNQAIVLQLSIFDQMRNNARPLYYCPVNRYRDLNLRDLFITANALSPETWGPQKDNTLAMYWRESLEPQGAKVQVYLQDPAILQKQGLEIKGKIHEFEDNSILDIMISFSSKEQVEKMHRLLKTVINDLPASLQEVIHKNRLVHIESNDLVFVLLLRGVNAFPDQHQALLNGYEKQSAKPESKISWQFESLRAKPAAEKEEGHRTLHPIKKII